MKFKSVRILLGGLFFLFSCATNTTPTSPNDQLVLSDSIPNGPIPGQMNRPKENTTTGTIHITVDENLMPIIEAEIDNFETLYPRATVHARYLPGEEAIAQMLNNDSIRMAISTRHLSREETAILKRRNISAKYAGIAYEGIALVVHKDNPLQKLTYEQLIGVLSGKISTWEQIVQEGLEGPINLVFDHAKSSTVRFLQDSILGDQKMTRDRVYAQRNTPEVLSYVAENPTAIGFGGWAWISDVDDREGRQLKSGVNIVWLEKKEETPLCAFDQSYFGPYQSYLLQRCYPLTRTVTTVMRESLIGLGTGFVAHLDGPQGQRLIHKSGLATAHMIPRKVKLPPSENSRKIKEKYWKEDEKSSSKK
ncbi:MAG: substrate-binding domain-containing protein [Bacteroidota bacterium]